MSADRLREAAALMRSRAEALSGEHLDPIEGWYAHLTEDGRAWVSGREGKWLSAHGYPNSAEHIASWHPVVALAVADWLEATAREFDALGNPSLECHPRDGRRTAALAVADAYLNTT